MRSDRELEQITVGEWRPHDAPIDLADYDPDWPRLFRREADRMRAVLGEAALRVEHVGSTSVPGLAAQPVIDIVLAVPDSADEPAYVPRLEAGGYVLQIREPDWYEHRLFKGPDTDINLHVFSRRRAGDRQDGAVPDWLRNDDRERYYCCAKRDLAPRPGGTCSTMPMRRQGSSMRSWSRRGTIMVTCRSFDPSARAPVLTAYSDVAVAGSVDSNADRNGGRSGEMCRRPPRRYRQLSALL